MGMKEVPINKIIGSEGRYRDFNKFFYPRSEHLRIRWERIDVAKKNDIPLPAIQLYEIGGAYFVRDGNHRVSVARAQGAEEIDAEVISLTSEIPITPTMTAEDLRKSVIQYEKKIFYEKTSFGKLTGCMDLDFTQTGCYDIIYNHILVHKYFLNQNKKEEISFDEALVSWYKNVYCPVIKCIEEDSICVDFPGRKSGDLYVWIIKHWDYLKKNSGDQYPIADAARDYSAKYGKRRGKISRFFSALFAKIFQPGCRKRG
jgi:hypothetical protein